MEFFANKLGPIPKDITSEEAARIKAAREVSDATAAKAVAMARAAAQVKAQQSQAGLREAAQRAPQTPPAPAPQPEKKKKGWF